MANLLFICSRNRLRSPTAEVIFGKLSGISTQSAGLTPDADTALTPDMLEWADVIFVMEPPHRARLSKRFGRFVRGKKIVCLNIQDECEFMEPALVELLWYRVPFRRLREGLTKGDFAGSISIAQIAPARGELSHAVSRWR